MRLKSLIPYLLILIIGLSAGGIGGYVARSMSIPKSGESENLGASSENQPDVQASGSSDVAVVFQPKNLFTGATEVELDKKLVKPLSYYSKEDSKPVASVMITSPGEGSGSWDILVIYKNGTTRNFIYGNTKIKTQQWWIPDCIKCKFSAEFKAMFPEVVKLSST